MGRSAALALMLILSGCTALGDSGPPAHSAVSPPAGPGITSAALAGTTRGPAIAALGLSADNAAAALDAFRESCPKALVRDDASGLADPADWRVPCEAAGRWPIARAAAFFETHFAAIRVGQGRAYATGYYEPEIRASRIRLPGFDVPVYAMPRDLVRGWPADTPAADRTGTPPIGRRDAGGAIVPFDTRAEIEDGGLAGRAPVIAWAADRVEFFFLQIQGSGRLRTPEGEVIRIGYAGQNGHGYTSIGAIMRDRGLLGEGPGQYPGSMQGIMAYLRENPIEGRALMRENESWVFFRELAGDGPIGAMGVPVRPRVSVATDPRFVPLGAPVWLDLDRDEADGLWIAQDTGGAIKGTNRFDTYWGSGEAARATAGTMSASGDAYVLLPRSAIERLTRR